MKNVSKTWTNVQVTISYTLTFDNENNRQQLAITIQSPCFVENFGEMPPPQKNRGDKDRTDMKTN